VFDSVPILVKDKKHDDDELAYLKQLKDGQLSHVGVIADPSTIEHDGRRLRLTEWSQMRLAKTSLAKLILALRLCRHLDPIWDALGPGQRTTTLRAQYAWAKNMIGCLVRCCNKDVKAFQQAQVEHPFAHYRFSCRCLPGK
jgi:hypothetical protein